MTDSVFVCRCVPELLRFVYFHLGSQVLKRNPTIEGESFFVFFFFGKVFVASRSKECGTSQSVLVIVGSVKEFCLTR